jgi:hypothetical protein
MALRLRAAGRIQPAGLETLPADLADIDRRGKNR